MAAPAKTRDVIIIGGGNAGFSAASAAVDTGARHVLLLEKAPFSWSGGNTTFTAGAYRTVFHGLDDVLPLVDNVTAELARKIDMEPYSEEDFTSDIMRVTSGRADPELARVLVEESRETTRWLAQNGVKLRLSFNRQAYEVDGRQRFWGGMVLSVVDGGKGLTAQHQANAARKGVEVRYSAPVIDLLRDGGGGEEGEKEEEASYGGVTGVKVRNVDTGKTEKLYARGGVILAAGGFEANPQLRAQYLGPNWDLAHVRGTPFNTGDLLTLSVNKHGAKPAGNWSGCHSTCWDANAPIEAGDQLLTNQFTKSGYPLGLMFNVNGDRFVDEGMDMRNFTYAKFGKAVLNQPGGVAFQVWDRRGSSWLRREEYAEDVVERINADTIEELTEKLESKGLLDKNRFVDNISAYNNAVRAHRSENPNATFDPSRKDGLSTRSKRLGDAGVRPQKSNWAIPIADPPFLAVKIACGVTFTFGGLKVDPKTSGAISQGGAGDCIPGLYAAGEMVGGLFYENYPGGSGLTSGAVFGRKAGAAAARRARERAGGKDGTSRARL